MASLPDRLQIWLQALPKEHETSFLTASGPESHPMLLLSRRHQLCCITGLVDNALPAMKLSQWLSTLESVGVKPTRVYRTKSFGQKPSTTVVTFTGGPDIGWMLTVINAWSRVFLGDDGERCVTLIENPVLDWIGSHS